MNNENAQKKLDKETIVFLLKKLDQKIEDSYNIVICGGAAGIAGYGLERYTNDIDILEVNPKSMSFTNSMLGMLEENKFELDTINHGASAFIDDLNPNFRKRLVPLNEEFKNLNASFISKPDLVTMKICAWREIDIDDVNALGITKEDLYIIDENLIHLAQYKPERAYEAQHVLSEIGTLQKTAHIPDAERKQNTLKKIQSLVNEIQSRQKSIKLLSPVVAAISEIANKTNIEPNQLYNDIIKTISDSYGSYKWNQGGSSGNVCEYIKNGTLQIKNGDYMVKQEQTGYDIYMRKNDNDILIGSKIEQNLDKIKKRVECFAANAAIMSELLEFAKNKNLDTNKENSGTNYDNKLEL